MMRLTAEQRVDAELAEIGVTAHITHLKQPDDTYFKVVTIATPKPEKYKHIDIALSTIYLDASVQKRSDLGKMVIERFSKMGCGVAMCHHRDNFSHKRGRIIAKGRMLKILRGEIKQ